MRCTAIALRGTLDKLKVGRLPIKSDLSLSWASVGLCMIGKHENNITWNCNALTP